MKIFWTSNDRQEYLRLLLEQGQRLGVNVLSYCLMTNHVHLVVVPEQFDSLARGIGEAHRRYTRGINFRQKKRGYLFQGRFHSCPTDEAHFIASVRYAERNPVRAGIVQRPWDYPWSSARFRVGRVRNDPLVEEKHPFGLTVDWEEMLLTEPRETPFLTEAVRTGRPCGDRWFVELAEKITDHRTDSQTLATRPTKEVLRVFPQGMRPETITKVSFRYYVPGACKAPQKCRIARPDPKNRPQEPKAGPGTR